VYFGIFALSTLAIIAAEGCDLISGFTAVAAGLNNIGPGLSLVGPSANYAWLTDFSKLLLCFDMIIGRLEIFPVLILFSPATWKKSL
jgi:trk system potassium uptake protein TrkH